MVYSIDRTLFDVVLRLPAMSPPPKALERVSEDQNLLKPVKYTTQVISLYSISIYRR